MAAFMFYTLMKPALTLENGSGDGNPQLICGMEEHVHTEACWGYDHEELEPVYVTSRSLSCAFVPHVHSEQCYDLDGNLICGISEEYWHVHDEFCYDHETLVCTLEEHAPEEEMEEVPVLVCGQEESIGHTHTDACYTTTYFTNEPPVCGIQESGPHTHSEECYGPVLICEEEHEHTDACFVEGLICGLEEGEGHAHTLECYPSMKQLTCGLEETAGHTHTEACYALQMVAKEYHVHGEACYTDGVLTCGQLEIRSHQHTAECWQDVQVLVSGGHVHNEECVKVLVCGFEEHVHGPECYSGSAEAVEALIQENSCEKALLPASEKGGDSAELVSEEETKAAGDDGQSVLNQESAELAVNTETAGNDAYTEEAVLEEEQENALALVAEDGELAEESGNIPEFDSEAFDLVGEDPEWALESEEMEEQQTEPEAQSGAEENEPVMLDESALTGEQAEDSSETDPQAVSEDGDAGPDVFSQNEAVTDPEEEQNIAGDTETAPENQDASVSVAQDQFAPLNYVTTIEKSEDGQFSVQLHTDEGVRVQDVLALAGVEAEQVSVASDIDFLEIGEDYFACRFAFEDGRVVLTADGTEIIVLCSFASETAEQTVVEDGEAQQQQAENSLEEAGNSRSTAETPDQSDAENLNAGIDDGEAISDSVQVAGDGSVDAENNGSADQEVSEEGLNAVDTEAADGAASSDAVSMNEEEQIAGSSDDVDAVSGANARAAENDLSDGTAETADSVNSDAETGVEGGDGSEENTDAADAESWIAKETAEQEFTVLVNGEATEQVCVELDTENAQALQDLVLGYLQAERGTISDETTEETDEVTEAKIWRVLNVSSEEALDGHAEITVTVNEAFAGVIPDNADLISVNYRLFRVNAENGEVFPADDFTVGDDAETVQAFTLGTDEAGTYVFVCTVSYAYREYQAEIELDLSDFMVVPEELPGDSGISVITESAPENLPDQGTMMRRQTMSKQLKKMSAAPAVETAGIAIDMQKLMEQLEAQGIDTESEFAGIRMSMNADEGTDMDFSGMSQESSDGNVSFDGQSLKILDNGTVVLKGNHITVTVRVVGFHKAGETSTYEYAFGETRSLYMSEIFASVGMPENFVPARFNFTLSDDSLVSLAWEENDCLVTANDFFEEVALNIERGWYKAVILLRNIKPAEEEKAEIWSEDGMVSVTLKDAIDLPEGTKPAVVPSEGVDIQELLTADFGENADVQVKWFDISLGDVHDVSATVTLPGVIELPENSENRVMHVKARIYHVREDGIYTLNAAVNGSDITFETDGFSQFGIAWVVTFENPQTGETYTLTLPAAEDIPLEEVLKGIGITGDAAAEAEGEAQSESESAAEFEKRIKNVESTNAETVLVTKTEESWTIRILKDGDALLAVTMDDDTVIVIDVDAQGVTKKASVDENVLISTVNDLYLPENASVRAEVMDESSAENAIEAVKAENGIYENSEDTEETGTTVYTVFDIALENVDIEAYDGFQVQVRFQEDVAGRDFRLYHFHGGITEEIALDTFSGNITENGQGTVTGFTFETKNFSEFVLCYTVDFHYEVNGKTYEFSIPGGGFVSLEHVVEVLGIARIGENTVDSGENEANEGENTPENDENTADLDVYNGVEETGIEENGANGSIYEESISLNNVEVSEATRQFVADVEKVEFSSPELVDVSKAENETTVAQIKEARGLEVQYSAELTEEQIAIINAQTLEVGDWALISLKAFDTEESLTVTMKNGEQFVIQVTDAQIQKNYISASGETYTITVTYGLQAGIPEGAVLWVDEILPDDEGYEPYVTDAASMIYCDVEELSHIRIFDISILSSDGEKIEPLEPVHVKITYNTPVQLEESQEVATIHFGETEPEVIDTRILTDDAGIIDEISFEAESFSAYAVAAAGTTDLNGKTLAIINNYTHDAVQDTALSNTALNKIRVIVNNNGEVAVTGNASEEISTWTFSSEGNNTYSIRNANGQYIHINGDSNVTLENNPQALTVNPGTSNRAGMVRITRNEYALNDFGGGNLNQGISGYNDKGDNEWFRLYSLNDIVTNRPSITVHYVDESGNQLAEPKNLADTTKVGDTANYTDPYIFGDIYDMYQPISGYAYQSAHLNDINGKQINAEVVYKYADSWNTNNDEVFPQTQVDTVNGARWEYQEPNRNHNNVSNYDLQQFGPNDNRVYVVYTKGNETIPSQGGHSGSGDQDDLDEPKPVKTLVSNDDGTYKLSLSVNASSKEISKTHGANVILIFDMSYSMNHYLQNGQSTNNTNDPNTRLAGAKAAAKHVAERLLAMNEGHESNPLLEMMVVPFNANAPANGLTNSAWVSNYGQSNNISSYVDTLGGSTDGGTNWEGALEEAKRVADLKVADEINRRGYADDTYILFMTDGNPWMANQENSHDTFIRDFFEKGSYFYATEPAREIVKAGYELYGIGMYGNVDVLHLLLNFAFNARSTYDPTSNAYGRFFLAQNQDALINALSDIAGSIEGKLAMAGVEIKDGIALDTTHTSLTVSGITRGIEYSKSAGTDGSSVPFTVTVGSDGKPMFSINGGDAQEGATVTKNYEKINDDGTISPASAEIYRLTVGSAVYEMAAASLDNDGNLDWDLSPLGILDNGATYTLSTTVWPDQEAYDLVTALNNGTAEWDESTQTEVKQDGNVVFYQGGASKDGKRYDHIVKYPTNPATYAALSNTYQTLDYFVVNIVEDQLTYEKGPTIYMPFPDPMELTDNTISLIKEWNKDLMPSITIPEDVTVSLHRDGELFISNIVLEASQNWKTTKYIAPGLMISKASAEQRGITGTEVTFNNNPYVILNEGHDYQFTEGFQANFELEKKVYHPMLIDSSTVLTDVKIEGTTVTATGNDISQGLTATNILKGGINIKKIVQDYTGEVIADSQEIFDVIVTMNVPRDEAGRLDFSNVDKYFDPSGNIVNNSVAWYAYYTDNGSRLYDDDLINLGILADSGDTYQWTDGSGTEHSSKIGDGINHPRAEFDNYGSGYFMIDFDDSTGVATGTVKIIPGYTLRFSNMAAGTTYNITETDESATGYIVSYSYDHQPYINGEPSGDPVPDQGETHTVFVGQANNATVINRQTKSDLIIIKEDDQGNAITSEDNTAEFKLTRNTANDGSGFWGNAVDNDNNPHLIVEGTITVNTTDGVELKGLADGLYQLKETKAPDGFIIQTGSVYFRLAGNTITFVAITEETDPDDPTKKVYTVTDLPDPPNGCTIKDKSADVPTIQLMIANTPGAALPNTGGPGTTAFYLLGIMLTAFAGTVLMMRKRRRDAV